MSEIEKILLQIQDNLVPKLDIYEQAIYRYIFRHTYLVNRKQALFSTRSAEIGFGTGDNSRKPSGRIRSKKLRSLETKGAVKIIERSNKGILVELVLPCDMNCLIEKEEKETLNMASLDFYKDRRLLPALLERENYRCFYTGKKIAEENSYLDHVTPESKGGGNSYSNIVATCYDANSMKKDMDVGDFARFLFKEDILSLKEFNKLKKKIEILQEGNLVPNEEIVSRAIS